MEATYVLKSKSIFNGTAPNSFSGGVVINENKIVGVFPEEKLNFYIGSNTKVIDFGNKLIMPGFIDSHMHFGGEFDSLDPSYCIDVRDAKSFSEVTSKISDFITKYPNNKVVKVSGYNFLALSDHTIPDKNLLDKYVSDRPLLIQTWEGHTFFVNTKTIEALGITKDTPDPNNGMGRSDDGEPNGVFNDSFAFKMAELTKRPLMERKDSMINCMKILNQNGITTISDMYPCGSTKPYPLYKVLEKDLTVRITFYPALLGFTKEEVADYQKTYNSPMLQFGGLKNLLDGVISVHTAWMTEPYADAPDTCGYPAFNPEDVKAKILEAAEMGIPVRIHTIGDKSVSYILDCFEEAAKKYGTPVKHNVMEHLEYVRDEDIPRFSELNVVCAMQGRHITTYVGSLEKIMGECSKLAFRWRDILDSGAIIGTGSDWNVVTFNPAVCIYAAVTRQREDGLPNGGLIPEQKVLLAEVLKAYTYGSACAINREKEIGTLEPGKLADIVVLDRDLFSAEKPEDYLDMKPILTMVDGRIVYQNY